jgi:hypothetical protein
MFKAQSNLNTVINVRCNNSKKAQIIKMRLNLIINMASNISLNEQRSSEERLKGHYESKNGPIANRPFKALKEIKRDSNSIFLLR